MKTLLLLSLVCIALVSAQTGPEGPPGQKGESGDVGSPGAPGTCSGSCSGGGSTVRACCVYLCWHCCSVWPAYIYTCIHALVLYCTESWRRRWSRSSGPTRTSRTTRTIRKQWTPCTLTNGFQGYNFTISVHIGFKRKRGTIRSSWPKRTPGTKWTTWSYWIAWKQWS